MTTHTIQCREIVERWVIEGPLQLNTPAHLGNGDSDELTDMPLLVDARDGKSPLLTGASLAGALRAYLGEWEHGYSNKHRYGAGVGRNSATVKLFGMLSGQDDGDQSRLIVEDALGQAETVERRHGVGIDRASRTAKEKRLYDTRLWPAGSTFKLRLELLISQDDDGILLRRALATALTGLTDGGITLGMRKRRGFGQACVTAWRVRCYDLRKLDNLLAWIEHGAEDLGDQPPACTNIAQALGVSALISDQRDWFSVEGEFSLDGSSLLIRTEGLDTGDPDMVYLQARQPDGSVRPVLSGTSLAGALRARVYKIIHTLTDSNQARRLSEALFGPEDIEGSDQGAASRLHVEERVISQARTDLVQHRVSIDRFTGGALPTALFNQQPAIGLTGTVVTLGLRFRAPEPHEIGLLLLLLKDLWTGDLPLGGESSVGRGRLGGQRLILRHHKPVGGQEWEITPAPNGGLAITNQGHAALESYVKELLNKLGIQQATGRGTGA